jgi:hypothetical protein
MEDNVNASNDQNPKAVFSVTLALIVGFILGGLFPVGNYLNFQKATSLDSDFAEKSLNENGRVYNNMDEINGVSQSPGVDLPYPYMCDGTPMIFELPDNNPQNQFTYTNWDGTLITCDLMTARVAKETTDEVLVNDLSAVGKLNSPTQPDPSTEKPYKCTQTDGSVMNNDFPNPPFNYSSFSITMYFNTGSSTWNCVAV